MSISINPMKEYIYDNTNKDIKSTIGFINDFAGLNSALVGIIQNKEFENMAQAFLNKMHKGLSGKEVIKINLANNEFLTATGKSFAKVSAYAVIIMSILDAIKYEKNEDYDALTATVGMITLNIVALFVTSGTPLVVFVSLSSIAYAIVMLKLEDSAFESYLKRSLFYKDTIYLESKDKKINGFSAKYLLETTNRKEELKAINSEGFTSAKKITNFIGENYKTNELYFDTALNNELSFLKASIYGYKLELLDRRKGKKLKNIYGNDVQLWQNTFVKIPKVIYDSENVKFIFVENDSYNIIEKSTLFDEKDYYVYDLYNQNFSYLEDFEFINKQKTSIIVISPQVELKYEFMYDYREIEYLDAINFKQVSFTIKDNEELKKFKEKKDKN
ncbi:hypothetical protein [Halarcobacter ebronensis]|uniref:Uncharacterized protein n=1 Tax=Halarcobacter ebronensis TaxID=1462615 RepID=A0A4Q1AFV8_9BACT|nr:hypothetical protein [Halarcobacter ebronensis]QKF81476.1 hypothetical protein AEBR_0977 [Halarcobacter ebronensis]RXK02463.1 hypothetical protein CRV07_13415 [Halarcobacter ebronensis]